MTPTIEADETNPHWLHEPSDENNDDESGGRDGGVVDGKVSVNWVHDVPDGVVAKSDPELGVYFDPLDHVSIKAKWVPYTGPQGGEGWKNTETGNVVYQDEPPGETVSPEDVVGAAEEMGLDPDVVRQRVQERMEDTADDASGSARARAREALDNANTEELFEEDLAQVEDVMTETDERARVDGVTDEWFNHIGKWNRKSLQSSDPERAFHRGKASSGTSDARSTIGLGASGSDDETVHHELAHALADTFAYDTEMGRNIAHNYSDWDRTWDFGGKDGRKKDHLFSKYTEWEDRLMPGLEDYVERGEVVSKDEVGDLGPGDRVAFALESRSGYSTDITEGTINNEDGDVLVDPDTGEEMYINQSVLGENRRGTVVKMRDASERDWVPTEDFGAPGDEPLSGEAVRFRFGAQDEAFEGVVTDEGGGQLEITYRDGGETKTKRVNRGQAYNQQLWVADDSQEFGEPRRSQDPPGYREARYEVMDLREGDVDWNTRVQYQDFGEQRDTVENGDLVLIKGESGQRATAKVLDNYEWHDNAHQIELEAGPGSDYIGGSETSEFGVKPNDTATVLISESGEADESYSAKPTVKLVGHADGDRYGGERVGPDHEWDDPEEAVDHLMSEVNKSWYRMADKREDENRWRNGNPVGGGYAETHAHETLTMFHQSMQSEDPSTADVDAAVRDHADLLAAYVSVFEPSDDTKSRLNASHNRNPYRSPWGEDDTPYPERNTQEAMAEDVRDHPDDQNILIPEGYPSESLYATIDEVRDDGTVVLEDENGEEVELPLEAVANEVRR